MIKTGIKGIIGGSFNPIHNAHLALAEQFLEETKAEEVFFVPCNVSPFKTDEEVAPAEHRIEMINLAIKDNPKFNISEYELNQKGISYTYKTIRYFKSKFPDKVLCLIIGGDQAESFHKWKNWKEILDNAELYIALRQGYKEPTYEFESYKSANYLDMPFLEISASNIREKLNSGIRDLEEIPEKVKEYINNNYLYI